MLLFKVSSDAAASLERAKGIEHIHLAQLLEVFEHEGEKLAVAELFTGLTLAERLSEVGKKETVDAVRYALRLADALSCLHDAGACHGFAHPRGILIQVEGHAPPLLGYFPTSDPGYRSPERKAADPPSEADDAWAAAALLHTMLLGEPPPAQGYASEGAVHDAGVVDSALCAALAHALNENPEARSKDLRPLKRELARWFVEHAGEEPLSPGPHSSTPPPLPGTSHGRTLSGTTSSAAPSPRTLSAPPPQKSLAQRILPLAIGGVLIGLVGGWVFNVLRARPQVVERIQPAAKPAPVVSAQPIDVGEVPVTGESVTVAAATDRLSSCVMGYMPKGTFATAPKFADLCEQTDPRAGASKLLVEIVTASPKGEVTEARKIFARIGWYDMAAFAVVRAGCCTDAKPLDLPEPSAGCSAMDEALRELGQAVVAMRPPEEALKKYSASIQCEINAGRGVAFRRSSRPASGEESAFLELVKAIQTP